MSTAVEQMPAMNESMSLELKPELKSEMKTTDAKLNVTSTVESVKDAQQHPLHQFDLTQMRKFYSACVGKLKEQHPDFEVTKWAERKEPIMTNMKNDMSMVFSSKQRLYEAFSTLARETGEPMVLMPNFDYGDLLNFERFLQALKQDGVNAIGKYKLYLNNKDMRKFEVDMVIVHPKYGVMLFEVKECDHLDYKRRSRAKAQLRNARTCFESMGRLISESMGWTNSEARLKCTDYIVLPNVTERPVYMPKTSMLNQSLNQTASSTGSSSGRMPRQMTYIIKTDLASSDSFAQWFNMYVTEPMQEQEKLMEEQNKVNKFNLQAMNYMLGLINCVRNNSIMPVVYPEMEMGEHLMMQKEEEEEKKDVKVEEQKDQEIKTDEKEKMMEKIEKMQFQPALNVHAEFFQMEHESVRSLSKVMVMSKDTEKIRKTICLQTLWFLLNDSQKKISVICSELNKAYYEEFFNRQRKLYNNLNNVRFYSNISACAVAEGAHTLRKDGEIWFFDAIENMSEVVDHVKELNAYWIFTTEEDKAMEYKAMMDEMKVRQVNLDTDMTKMMKEMDMNMDLEMISMPWLTGKSMKLPLRLQCDLLVIGDLINVTQLKSLYRYLKSSHVVNFGEMEKMMHNDKSHKTNRNDRNNQQQEQKQYTLNFNPTKKFRSVKFVRGGTIDSLRSSLKMHDSIQASVVLMHVGDEDLFKSRNPQTTVERVKELTTLIKEYCPKSFTILSHLMKRMSRTENTQTNEVNKGMDKFCKESKEAKEMINLVHMNNMHMEPEQHHQDGGRTLSNKGLRMYVENFLYHVDYYMIKHHKQN